MASSKCPNCGLETELYMNINIPLEEWDWKNVLSHFEKYKVVTIRSAHATVTFRRETKNEDLSQMV